VITGSEAVKPAIPRFADPLKSNPNPNPENLPTKGKASATSKPAIAVITDFGVGLSGQEPEDSKAVGSASTCEPYREIIELGLSRDRNAMAIWQDLVSDYGFRGGYQSVRRFAYKLRGAQVPPARAVILTAHVHGAEAHELLFWLALVRCIVRVYIGRDFVLARSTVADHRGENQDAFLPAFDEAAKRVPRADSRNVGGVRFLQSTHTLPMF